VSAFAFAMLTLLSLLAISLVALILFLIYAVVRYSPIIGRIFEEKPLFLPLQVPPRMDGEEVLFSTSDGLKLSGSYFRARTSTRIGVVVFCHEYLSDRWSFEPYADSLRNQGFDVFAFDFRNHGSSASDPAYHPLQWVTDHEVRDLRAALDALRSRPDHDPAGFALLGISRGGGAALVVAAEDPTVWGVVTDGAFPTDGTMTNYILRWAEIYVHSERLVKWIPLRVYQFLGWTGRIRSQYRLSCRFPKVEQAAARLAPRPWLMIHGGRDAYIGPEIAQQLFDMAGDPKELWIIPNAKHNRCRELEPDAYAQRLADFFRRHAPRRAPLPVPAPAVALPTDSALDVASACSASTITGGLAAPLGS
jgi:alpha-beta hydrolase superfamily lysophospholipase